MKEQEEAEEQKKQAEMDTFIYKEQQVPEDQKSANPQWNTRRNNNVSIRHGIYQNLVWFLVLIAII